MVRRAGLIDSPDGGVVQTPNLSGGVPPQVAQTYVDLAKLADTVSQTVLKPMADEATRARAMDAVAKGDLRTTNGFTEQDQLYDKIIDAGFMANASTDMERMLGELQNKRLEDLNTDELKKDLSAARTSYLSKIPSKYAVPLGQAWDRGAVQATERISGLAIQRGIRNSQEAVKARIGLLVDQVSGVSDYGAPEVQNALAEIESLQAAAIKTGWLTQDAADADMAQIFGRFTGNRVQDEAVAVLADMGYTPEAEAAAIKLIDDTLSSPEVGLGRAERDHYVAQAKTAVAGIMRDRREAERELERQIREAKAAALADFQVDYADATLAAAQGTPWAASQLHELMAEAVATGNQRHIQRVGRLLVTTSMADVMKPMSLPQMDAAVNQLELAAQAGDQEAVVQLQAARAIQATATRSATADPAGYDAMRSGREATVIDWSHPESIGESMAKRFGEAEDGAQRMGVAPKYFSPADRATVKAIADRGGVDALRVASTLAMAADEAGVNPLSVFEELGGAGGNAALMATAGALIAQDAPPQTAQMILTGVQAMKTELVKDKMPKQATQARVQRTVLGDTMTRMTPAEVDAITRSADAYYAADLLENQGVAQDGEAQAYERAMRAVMGEHEENGVRWGGRGQIADKPVTAPPWIAQGQFATVLRNLTEADLRGGMTGRQMSGIGYYRGRPVSPADFRSAAFIDAGAGRYYIAPDPAHPEWKVYASPGNPEPATIDLNLIRETLKERYPTGVK